MNPPMDRHGPRLVLALAAGLLIMMIASQKGRPDRIAAMYPVLFAGGAVWIEALAQRRRLGWVRPASVALIVVAGLLFLPLAVPLLPPDVTARYASAAGIVPQIELIGVHRCSYCMPWRAEMPIYRVSGAKSPLADVWPRFEHYE